MWMIVFYAQQYNEYMQLQLRNMYMYICKGDDDVDRSRIYSPAVILKESAVCTHKAGCKAFFHLEL